MRTEIVLIICLFVLLTSSCSHFNYEVIKKSRKYETMTQLNNIIEHYSRCYYSLPSNKQSLIDFLDKWRIEDSSTFCIQREIYTALKKEYFLMAAFEDSVFLYFPSRRIGTCVIGHPLYWIENPDLYPTERLDYWWNFQIAAYRKDGSYCFTFDYSSLTEKIKQLNHKYENVLFTQNSGICKSKTESLPFTTYRAVACFDVINDSLYIISPILDLDKLYLLDKDKQEYSSVLEISKSLNTLCRYYFDDLKTVFKLMSNDNITKFIFLLTPSY